MAQSPRPSSKPLKWMPGEPDEECYFLRLIALVGNAHPLFPVIAYGPRRSKCPEASRTRRGRTRFAEAGTRAARLTKHRFADRRGKRSFREAARACGALICQGSSRSVDQMSIPGPEPSPGPLPDPPPVPVPPGPTVPPEPEPDLPIEEPDIPLPLDPPLTGPKVPRPPLPDPLPEPPPPRPPGPLPT